jgi:hypothetical protein
MILKIIIWVVGLLIISNLFVKYQKKEISFSLFLIWLVIWAGIITGITLSPESDKLAIYLGLGQGRGIELSLFLAIVIIFYIIFRIYLNLSRIETQMSEIVKHIAIMNVKKKKRK